MCEEDMACAGDIFERLSSLRQRSRAGGKNANQYSAFLAELDAKICPEIDKYADNGEYQPCIAGEEESDRLCDFLNGTLYTSLRMAADALRAELTARKCLAARTIFTKDIVTKVKQLLLRDYPVVCAQRLFYAVVTSGKIKWPLSERLIWFAKDAAYRNLCDSDTVDASVDNTLINQFHNCMDFHVVQYGKMIYDV